MVDTEIHERVLDVFRIFNERMREMAASAHQFVDAWYTVAERAYLEHHDRLPGGTRTRRLVKKRRARVLQ